MASRGIPEYGVRKDKYAYAGFLQLNYPCALYRHFWFCFVIPALHWSFQEIIL